MQGRVVRQELCKLNVLDFLIDEMRFESDHPVVPHLALQQQPVQTAVHSVSPQQVKGHTASSSIRHVTSPSRRPKHQTRSPSTAAATDIALTATPAAQRTPNSTSGMNSKSANSASPSKRVPAVADYPGAELLADRGDSLHVPASAPTSSSASSPVSPAPVLRVRPFIPPLSASQASPSANRAASLPHTTGPLNPLPAQFGSRQYNDDESPTKILAEYSVPQQRRSSDDYHDENSFRSLPWPPRSPGSGVATFGDLDAPDGFVYTGDVNEDVDRLIAIEVCTMLNTLHSAVTVR